MNLHKNIEEFNNLANVVSKWKNIPENAVKRDYYIVLLLNNLSASKIFKDKCVFKGGTSLSKCYPNSIERFSEDIDLTYLGMDEDDKTCEKQIYELIKIMTIDANTEKIPGEGNKRNKSRIVWFGDDKSNSIKLEIGSSVKPDPYSLFKIKTYIQDYLEQNNLKDVSERYELSSVEINALSIERTFIDKIMAIKRHAYCNNLIIKVRHIYDVVKLYKMNEIKSLLENKNLLKDIVRKTKDTDNYYLEKRICSEDYNPEEKYDFGSWKEIVNRVEIRKAYERLHIDLLYTNEKQNFNLALNTLEEISKILDSIGE